MRAIGLRAGPRGFSWVVTEGYREAPILVADGEIQVPKTYDFARGANYLRVELSQLIKTHAVTIAGLRTPERIRAVTDSVARRFRIEGVLLASCSENGLHTLEGPLATLSSKLGVKSAKLLLDSDDFRGVDIGRFSKEKREAALMSAALLKKNP